MIWPDVVNGTYEVFAGAAILNHCRVLFRDKEVRGVSTLSTAFFASWGAWNLYYYPVLGQWWSFFGGLVVFSANALWLAMMLRYRK